MAQYTDTFGLGATILIIPPANASNYQFIPPRSCNGGFFKIQSGGGTLALLPSAGASTTAGYLIGGTEVVQFSGAAAFWLGASGTTMTVGVGLSYSSGYSLLP